MNPLLEKDFKPKYRNQAKYMERHQTLCVTLNKNTDADIIDWLNCQDNRSKAVRKVLRKVARFRKDEQARRALFGDPKAQEGNEGNQLKISQI